MIYKPSLLNTIKFTLTTILALTLLITAVKPTFAQNLFHCNHNFVDDCYVDPSTISCEAGHGPIAAICDQFDNDIDSCLSAINNQCILTASSLFRCASAGQCQPCQPGDFGCTYSDFATCDNACSSAPNAHRCFPNQGCFPDPNCENSNDPNCFASAAACESSSCSPLTPTPLPNCSAIFISSLCVTTPGCDWINGSCHSAGITPNPTPPPTDSGPGLPAFSICKYVDCPCDGDPQEGGGIPTALGCVPTDATAFISRLAVFALSLAGGIAFLLMLYGVLVVATAAGNPERYSAGIQTATSALAGLLAIIFSATALQIIGIEIISLPGF